MADDSKVSWDDIAPKAKNDNTHTWHDIAREGGGTPSRNLPGPAPFSPGNTDYYQYGRPGTNDMGPSGSWANKPKTQSLGKLPTEPPAAPGAKPQKKTGQVSMQDPVQDYGMEQSYGQSLGGGARVDAPLQGDFGGPDYESYGQSLGGGVSGPGATGDMPDAQRQIELQKQQYYQQHPTTMNSPVPPGAGTHPENAWNPGPITNAQLARLNPPSGTWIESPPGHVWQVA